MVGWLKTMRETRIEQTVFRVTFQHEGAGNLDDWTFQSLVRNVHGTPQVSSHPGLG